MGCNPSQRRDTKLYLVDRVHSNAYAEGVTKATQTIAAVTPKLFDRTFIAYLALYIFFAEQASFGPQPLRREFLHPQEFGQKI